MYDYILNHSYIYIIQTIFVAYYWNKWIILEGVSQKHDISLFKHRQ